MKKLVYLAAAAAVFAAVLTPSAMASAAQPVSPLDTCHNPKAIYNSPSGYLDATGLVSGDFVPADSVPFTWCQISNGVYTLFRAQGTSLCLTAQTNNGDLFLLACDTNRSEQNWAGTGSNGEMETKYDFSIGPPDYVATGHGPGRYVNTATSSGSSYQNWQFI